VTVATTDSELTAQRQHLRTSGFSPLPVGGKVPSLKDWQNKFDTTPGEIRLWEKLYSYDQNTGLLCRFTPAIDIDITYPEAAEAIENLARAHFEERGRVLVRIGKAPKRLIPLRTDEPFAKILRTLFAPNGSKHRIEVLGDGQQFVAFGIHPDTKRPYYWHGGSPGEVKREDLPYVRAGDVRAFLDAAAKLLVAEFDFKDLSEPSAVSVGAATWSELAASDVVKGARNNTIARFAGHLLRRYVDPRVTLELLLAWNAIRCKPPLEHAEVVRTINSVAGKELRRRSQR
jgi:hypothetical protein